MTIQTRLIEYTHEEVVLEAFLAWDDSAAGPRPGVLVSHAFRGREEFECNKARLLAEMGYVGFALDLYGKGVKAESNERAFEMMSQFTENRPLLHSRLKSVLAAVQNVPEVDSDQLAAIGFCFGGLCVLDMARTGLPVKGVASFHGILSAPRATGSRDISAKIMLEHGWDDPMATPENVLSFAEEMKRANADWQLHAHGNTVHSFTNPEANDLSGGTAYDANADRRSWQSLGLFLKELFVQESVGLN